MVFIIVDTCVWINLASTPPLHELLDALRTHGVPPAFQLVVPSSVQTEFDRNRDNCRTSWAKSIRGNISNFKNIYNALPGVKQDLSEVQERAMQLMQTGQDQVETNIDLTDALLRDSQSWKPSANDCEEACSRCLQLRAPAVNSTRTSVGDCLLWLAVLDLLGTGDVWFCSENRKDFSKQDKFDEIHPDLREEANRLPGTFRYFNDPTVLIKEIRSISLSTQHATSPQETTIPSYYQYAPQPPNRCPRCNEANTFGSDAFLRSMYGGLTRQYICGACGYRFDTGDSWD